MREAGPASLLANSIRAKGLEPPVLEVIPVVAELVKLVESEDIAVPFRIKVQ